MSFIFHADTHPRDRCAEIGKLNKKNGRKKEREKNGDAKKVSIERDQQQHSVAIR